MLPGAFGTNLHLNLHLLELQNCSYQLQHYFGLVPKTFPECTAHGRPEASLWPPALRAQVLSQYKPSDQQCTESIQGALINKEEKKLCSQIY